MNKNTKMTQEKIYAGVFSSWLRRIQYMLLKDKGVKVPCGNCRGCCTSSKFIHIGPAETKAISCIPKKFLFNAPLLPKGNLVMGYDDKGQCPMFKDNQCAIYDDRPLTCRNYDCRIFSAADLLPGNDESRITEQVKLWKYAYVNSMDSDLHNSVRSVACFIKSKSYCFPNGKVPVDSSQIAILAIKAYGVFKNSQNLTNRTDEEVASAIVYMVRQFDEKRERIKSKQVLVQGK